MRVFGRRKFWPQVIWLSVLFSGGGLSCVFDSSPLLIASILASFLGLTENGRWSHKANLIICTSGAVLGSICGVFTWFDTAAVFILLLAIGGFMLYYRDSGKKFINGLDKFSTELSREKNIEGIVKTAVGLIRDMTEGDEVFVAVADKRGGMYMPGKTGRLGSAVPRNGCAAWKVLASGRSYVTGRIEGSRDLPFYRNARSMISAVLSTRGEKIGVLQIESGAPHAFSDDDLKKLELLSFVLSQSLYPMMDGINEEMNDEVNNEE